MARSICLYFLDFFCRLICQTNENYFDSAASKPILSESLISFIEISLLSGNSNADNRTGLLLRSYEDEARQVIAAALNVPADSVVFTSGATEANNIIIQGVVRAYVRKTGKRAHIVSSEIEHPSVLAVLKNIDVDYTLVRADSNGKIRVQDIADALRDNTALVSIHALHHEIGIVQDIHSIHNLCRSRDIPMHCDASQAFCHDIELCGDFITISGHKIGAPKGIGAFFIRDRSLCDPLMYGGGREPLRPGTVPTSLIVSFAAAVKQNIRIVGKSRKKMQLLRSALSEIPSLQLITPPGDSHILCIKIPGVFQKDLDDYLGEFILSKGAACGSSVAYNYSYRALGLVDDSEIASFLRLSVHENISDKSISMLKNKLWNFPTELLIDS